MATRMPNPTLRKRFRRSLPSQAGRWSRLTTGLAQKVIGWVDPVTWPASRRERLGRPVSYLTLHFDPTRAVRHLALDADARASSPSRSGWEPTHGPGPTPHTGRSATHGPGPRPATRPVPPAATRPDRELAATPGPFHHGTGIAQLSVVRCQDRHLVHAGYRSTRDISRNRSWVERDPTRPGHAPFRLLPSRRVAGTTATSLTEPIRSA